MSEREPKISGQTTGNGYKIKILKFVSKIGTVGKC